MKSHVSLGQHQCLVCLAMFDTNEVLLHKELRPVLEPKTCTGHGICPTCNGRIQDGYIALDLP